VVSVDGGEVQVGDRGATQATGLVSAVVHLNKPSLSQAGKGMSGEQRAAHAAEVATLQDQVAAQVAALGGTVIGRFRTLSSGLAIRIDASRLADLRGLANVGAVRQVNNYEVDLSETVPFIGAADLHAAGLDGTGVTVAVLDDGADYTHIKLGGSGDPADYLACAATKTTIGDCAFFPNAKIIGGYDFVGGLWTGGSTSPPEMPDPDPIALSFHGTHVADIIGGWGLDGTPTGDSRGVAPGVEMYAFKVCSELTSSCSGLGLLLATDAAADLDGDPATHDPADVINASIGSPYGQPEDDWTAFVNEAVANGSIYVISAGNSSDKPYIVGSASTATGAISVAQTSVPSDALFFIRIDAPAAGLITNTAFQDWSVPLQTTGAISGTVLYDTTNASTRIGCTDDVGTSPWAPGALAGQIVLVDRGLCAGSLKVSNAAAAGAKLVIIALIAPGAPFSFAFGGARPMSRRSWSRRRTAPCSRLQARPSPWIPMILRSGSACWTRWWARPRAARAITTAISSPTSAPPAARGRRSSAPAQASRRSAAPPARRPWCPARRRCWCRSTATRRCPTPGIMSSAARCPSSCTSRC
jgi:hypothetical protein